MRTPLRFAAPLFLLALCAWPGTAAAQWRYPPFYPYPAYRYVGPDSSLRIQVKPKDASVYGRLLCRQGRRLRRHLPATARRGPVNTKSSCISEGFRSLKQRLYLGARTRVGRSRANSTSCRPVHLTTRSRNRLSATAIAAVRLVPTMGIGHRHCMAR